MTRRLFSLLVCLTLILARPAATQDFTPGSFPPMNWRHDSLWPGIWSSRWAAGIFETPRLSLSEARGGVQEKIQVGPGEGTLTASLNLQDIPLLPPRVFTAAEYAHEALEVKFSELWRSESLRTLKGDPSLSPSASQGGLVNLTLPFELPGFASSIFGEGAPNLRISGSERITIGGTSNWRSPAPTTEGRKRSLFPTLEMRQELNVRLNGTIGDKLHIDIAQNSEAATSLENQIKIYYQGYDDDVIQRVDLGNTNLTLPRATYVSVSTRQEGLFGVKMTGRLADWDFAAIASKQEGQSDVATYSGGTQETKIGGPDQKIDDYDFEKRKYFYLTDPDTSQGYRVDGPELTVFISTRNETNDNLNGRQTFKAVLTTDGIPTNALRVQDTVVKLTPNDDYFFDTSDRTFFPLLILRNSLDPAYRLGVSYIRRNPTGGAVVDTVGNFFQTLAVGDSLHLQMIKPANDDYRIDDLKASPWSAVRRLEVKNVYSLGARNIDTGTLNINIHTTLLTNEPTTLDGFSLLEICGLDLINNTTSLGINATGVADNQKGPDGLIDPLYLSKDAGILFMPDLRPFDPSDADLNGGQFRAPSRPGYYRRKALGYESVNEGDRIRYNRLPDTEARKEINSDLYDKRDVTNNYRKYYLAGSFRAFATEINLNRPGILENSETVRMDNEVLVRGVDYNISYDTGQVHLLSSRATNPQGNLQITYSYTPLFSQGNRSLVGFSTTYGGSPNWDLSTTFLYETKGSTESRPRLQQEPSRTMLADLAGSWRLRPWLLTRITNALPILSATAPSNLVLSGAIGVSRPNPNTKNTVYVDDMEGAIQTTSASVAREAWQWSSRPVAPDLADSTRLGGLWYSVQRSVKREDLSPELSSTIEGNDFVSALGVILTPNPALSPTQRTWFGLTYPLSAVGTDLSEAQYLEIWINDFNRFHGPNAAAGMNKKIRIDLGRVSEDAVWDPRTPPAPSNGRLDTEDRNHDGQRSDGEDLGLDGMTSAEEIAAGIKPDSTDIYTPTTPGDPVGDDYSFEGQADDYSGTIADRIKRFRHINGDEGNLRLDTEKLDESGAQSPTLENDYFELTFELGSDSLTAIDVRRDNPEAMVPAENGWRLLRIPLNHPTISKVGTPDLNSVQHIRLWFDGFNDTTEFQIASIDIVGNRWQRQKIRAANGQEIPDAIQFAQKKVFNVASVDNKQGAGYTPPFQPRTTDQVTELERSLNLQVENLDPGESVFAFRSLLRDEDYTLYQVLQFYLQLRNGMESFPGDSLDFVLRFSSTASADTQNAYEVSRFLDHENEWQSFDLPITELSNLKVGIPQSALSRPDSVVVDTVISNGWRARIYGQPSFSQLRRLQVGLRNVGTQRIVKREVWFDELRLGDVLRDTGMAGRGAVSLSLSDFATISSAIDRRNADFLNLGQSRGSGVSTESFTLSSTANLDRFAPGSNLSLPLSYDWRSSRNVPKFRANNDIIFDGNDSGLDITENKSRAINLNVRRISNQYTPWFIRNTIDALSFRVGLANSYNRATTSIDSTKAVNAGANWSLRINSPLGIPLPARWKLTVIPETITTSYAINDQKTVNYTRDVTNPTVITRLRETNTKGEVLGFQAGWRPLPPLTYTLGSQRDLADAAYSRFTVEGVDYRPSLKFAGIDFGRETSRSERLTFNQSFNLTSFFRPRVSWSGEYTENHSPDITTNTDFDTNAVTPPDLKSVENRSSTQVSWTIPVAGFFQKLARAPSSGRPPVRGDIPGGVPNQPNPQHPVNPAVPGGGPGGNPSPFPGAKPGSQTAPVPPPPTPAHADTTGHAPGGTSPAVAAPVIPDTVAVKPLDPKALEKQRKQELEAQKKEAERKKKEEEEFRKREEEAAKQEREAVEKAKKEEEKRRKEEAKKAEAPHGGIGGRHADQKESKPDTTGHAVGPGAAPPPATPATGGATAAADTGATATPPVPGGKSAAETSAETQRRAREAERQNQEAQKRADEERKRQEAQADAARKAAQPAPTLGQLLFRDIFSISDIRTNLNFSDRNGANRVNGSPSVPFRLGLSNELTGLVQATNSTLSSSNSVTASANATVNLFRDIGVDGSYQRTDQENDNNRAISRASSTIWPSLRVNLNSLEKKLRLGRFFSSFTAASNYERREEVNGTAAIRRERVSGTSSWRPLLQFDATWRNGVHTTFSADHSETVSETNSGGQAQAGVITTRTTNAYRVSLAKSLVARGASRGGRNTVDLNLDLTYNRDTTLNDYTDRPSLEDPKTQTDNLQGRFSTGYRFTTTVSGSLQLNYSQRHDYQAGQTDRSIGLQATAAITF